VGKQNPRNQLNDMNTDVRNIMLWGSSSHAGYTSEIVERQGKYEIKFLYDPTLDSDTRRHGYRVLSGGLEDLKNAIGYEGVKGVIVAIGDNFVRHSVSSQIKDDIDSLKFVSAVHDSAVIGGGVEIGRGVVVMAGVVVTRYSRIGEGAFLATNCSVGYDTDVRAFANVLGGVETGGNCSIRERAAIGMGSTIIQEVEVGPRTVVGAGSLVLNDIPKDVVAFGSPAEVVKKRPDNFRYL